MLHKSKAFYTPVYSTTVPMVSEFKENLKTELSDFAQNDIPTADGDDRIMHDGKKGYYSNAMTFENSTLPMLNTFVLALQDLVKERLDPQLYVADYGFNIHTVGTYQTIINNREVEWNGNFILTCPNNIPQHNGEYRLVNPNTWTIPLYHSLPVRENMLFLWPGPVLYEMQPIRPDIEEQVDRISIQLYIERERNER